MHYYNTDIDYDLSRLAQCPHTSGHIKRKQKQESTRRQTDAVME